MKCRKVKAVIRYHTPNKTKEPEQYFHHLLMLYYPWRQETELLGNEQTYLSKFYEPEVQAVVERNKNTFEPDSDAVIEALETLRNSGIPTLCSYCSESYRAHLGPTKPPLEKRMSRGKRVCKKHGRLLLESLSLLKRKK